MRKNDFPVEYAEAVLAGRDLAIEAARNALMAHEQAKPKGAKANDQWHGARNKLKVALQLKQRNRLKPLRKPGYLDPSRWQVGDVGYLMHLDVENVRDSTTLEVKVGETTIVGTDNAPRVSTMGSPIRTPRAVYGKQYFGKGIIENFPTEEFNKKQLAFYGIYQVTKAGTDGYRLKYLCSTLHQN